MSEPVWIETSDALLLHARLLALHGGATGLRDETFDAEVATAEGLDIIDTATAYTSSIVRNPPFINGSRRTGFLVGILFLELNGFRFTAAEEAAATAVLGLAAGSLDEIGYANFLRANTQK